MEQKENIKPIDRFRLAGYSFIIAGGAYLIAGLVRPLAVGLLALGIVFLAISKNKKQ